MIQRTQTLWMILAAIAVFLTIRFSFYSGTLLLDNSYEEISATQHFLLLVLTSALGTGIIINIFLYRHRSIQIRIIIISLVVECLILYLYLRQTSQFATGNFNLWAVLHLLIIVFLILAAKGIYKDSKLVRDSNRLR